MVKQAKTVARPASKFEKSIVTNLIDSAVMRSSRQFITFPFTPVYAVPRLRSALRFRVSWASQHCEEAASWTPQLGLEILQYDIEILSGIWIKNPHHSEQMEGVK